MLHNHVVLKQGNTGFYVMHPTKAMRTFLAGAMHR